MPLSMLGKAPFASVLTAVILSLPPAAAGAVEPVDLPAAPPVRRTLALEEVWRVGGNDDDILLGLVTSGVIDENGNVLLVDRQLSRVVVISPDGELVGTLGREGDGPGELRRLQGVFIAGERVGLVQGFPGKVVFIDRLGAPAGGFTLGGTNGRSDFCSIRDLRCVGTALVVHADYSSEDFAADRCRTHETLLALDLDGTIQAELVSHDVTRGMRNVVLDEAASWAEFHHWAVSGGGLVATVAERDAWSVNVRGLDGDLRSVLRRPCRPRRRTDEEKEKAADGIRLSTVVAGATMERKPLDTDPVIVDLQFADDGRLFVTTCHNAARQLPDGVAGRFDVIDPAGTFLEELTLAFPGVDPGQDVLVFLDGTRFLLLRNFEDAEKAIHAANLPEEEREDPGDAEPFEVVLVKVVIDR
ncbi:MAG: hypothetical protein AB7V45_15735 [Candidatus Krumholzibacteriia bacterium]